jgi:hypothetical protein
VVSRRGSASSIKSTFTFPTGVLFWRMRPSTPNSPDTRVWEGVGERVAVEGVAVFGVGVRVWVALESGVTVEVLVDELGDDVTPGEGMTVSDVIGTTEGV